MSSFLTAAENVARQRQNVRCVFLKDGRRKHTFVELAFEGHSLFISGQKYNFKPKLTKGQRQISDLLTAPLLVAAVSIFFKT